MPTGIGQEAGKKKLSRPKIRQIKKIEPSKDISRGKGRKRFLLAMRRDRTIQILLFLIPIFILLLAVSFVYLPLSTSSDYLGVGLNEAAIQSGTNSVPMTYDLPPGSYFNLSYNLSGGSYGDLSVTVLPLSLFTSEKTRTVDNATVSGIGNYSYHNMQSPEKVTILVTLHGGNSSSYVQLNFSANKYYLSGFNPYIFGGAVLVIVAFLIGMGARIMTISKDTGAYYRALNRKQKRAETVTWYGEGEGADASEIEPEDERETKLPEPPSPLYFLAGGIALSTLAVFLGMGNPGEQFLSILMYGVAAVILVGAVLTFFVRRYR